MPNNTNQHQIYGIDYRTNDPIVVTVDDGIIVRIERNGGQMVNQDELTAPYLAPGLVDLQINGYKGYDFNTFPLAIDTVIAATRALAQEGVTTFFPTVTTNSTERITEAMSTIAEACSMDEHCAGAIAGIHLEGPFISPEDGPRGAHQAAYVQAPQWSLFERWQEASGGRIRIITCSPEWPDSAEFIRRCSETGVTVSIGHTAATPEQIREAVAAGARMSTHFGNGSHLMLPRHPNYLWEQLAQDDLWTGLIADGFHLPESFLKVALKVKGQKAMLVSDSVDLGGMPPGTYHSHRRVHVVKTQEGKLHLRDNPGLLAGSAQALPWGIAHMASRGICTLTEAWEMASLRPAGFMNLQAAAGLTEGAPADLALFRWDGTDITILQSYKNGRKML